MTVRQLTNHFLQLETDLVNNRNITDRCIGRNGHHLNFSGTIQLAKNFVNFIKKLKSVKEYPDICNLMPESAYPLTYFSDKAFERSTTTAVVSDNDISHGLCKNMSGSVSIACQYVEDYFKDTLKKLRMKI